MSLTSIADHSDRTTASNLAFEALLSLLYSPLEIKVQISAKVGKNAKYIIIKSCK